MKKVEITLCLVALLQVVLYVRAYGIDSGCADRNCGNCTATKGCVFQYKENECIAKFGNLENTIGSPDLCRLILNATDGNDKYNFKKDGAKNDDFFSAIGLAWENLLSTYDGMPAGAQILFIIIVCVTILTAMVLCLTLGIGCKKCTCCSNCRRNATDKGGAETGGGQQRIGDMEMKKVEARQVGADGSRSSEMSGEPKYEDIDETSPSRAGLNTNMPELPAARIPLQRPELLPNDAVYAVANRNDSNPETDYDYTEPSTDNGTTDAEQSNPADVAAIV